ncbi:hypothetical protein [Pseudoxanthomonas suwonensis]|uniref:hypothetical protein n=1 Tax=Pseudoxanthomonas suwonensis TaxID=314722 RepID=UPI00048CF2AD|nr:hypothetical protein [Pseudoxanthomonas suwonensis]
MSIQSKARRDARKRKAEKERNRARAGAPQIEPHAELRDRDGNLLAGIVRRAGVWVLGMDGRIAGSSDSAAQVLMLIRRAQRLHDDQGVPVKLVYSDALRDEAELEAAANGLSLADYERQLEEEMAAAKPAQAEEGGEGEATVH